MDNVSFLTKKVLEKKPLLHLTFDAEEAWFLIGLFLLIYAHLAGLHLLSVHYKAYMVIEVGKIA